MIGGKGQYKPQEQIHAKRFKMDCDGGASSSGGGGTTGDGGPESGGDSGSTGNDGGSESDTSTGGTGGESDSNTGSTGGFGYVWGSNGCSWETTSSSIEFHCPIPPPEPESGDDLITKSITCDSPIEAPVIGDGDAIGTIPTNDFDNLFPVLDADDHLTFEKDPDCSKPFGPDQPSGLSEQEYNLWCKSYFLDIENEVKFKNILNEVEKIGGECVDVAVKGRELIDQGRLKLFRGEDNDGAGYGGPMRDGSGDFVLINDRMLHFEDVSFSRPSADGKDTYNINLQYAIVHEIDHTLGYGHKDNDPWLTENSLKCSGIN